LLRLNRVSIIAGSNLDSVKETVAFDLDSVKIILTGIAVLDNFTLVTVKARKTAAYHHGDLRQALLRAGEAELADRGIEGFSLRGVARRAGVSHAAPAHHFQDAGGLLTALAAEGFRRLIQRQAQRQKKAPADPISQLVASGLGYIDFALNNPALFRVVFSSGRPVHSSAELLQAASDAFGLLERDVTAIFAAQGGTPARTDVLEVWAVTHGLADLLNGGRMKFICDMRKAERDATVAAMLRTSFTELAGRARR
jgi:AcrR family transcriptional regulator